MFAVKEPQTSQWIEYTIKFILHCGETRHSSWEYFFEPQYNIIHSIANYQGRCAINFLQQDLGFFRHLLLLEHDTNYFFDQ